MAKRADASRLSQRPAAELPGDASSWKRKLEAEYMSRAGFVSLIGRPNAGKSTLSIASSATKVAIVSDKPQTTRNRIVAVKNHPDGQIVFVDTPGIHRPLHRLNVRMVDAAVETLREVDVVALVFDASTRPGHGDEYVLGPAEGRQGAGRAGAEQDRPGRQAGAAAAHRAGAGVASVRGDRAGFGGYRRRRRPPGARAARAPAGGRADLSRRTS